MKKILLLTAMCVLGLFTLKAQEPRSLTTLTNEGALSEVVTIGGDSETFLTNIPFNCWYGNSFSQQIYTKEDINFMNGNISKIAFMQKTTASYTRDLVIYMINTEKESFTGWYDWAEVSTSDIVFQGQVTTTTEDSWLEIELQNKFYYEGGSLILCVQDNTNDYDDWFDFQVFETDTVARTLANSRDSKPYDINNLTEADNAAGNTMTARNSVQFTIEYEEGLNVFPEEISLGNIQLGEYWPEKEEASANVTVYSGGIAVTSITCDNDFFILSEIDLAAEPIKFVVGYDKTASVGEYTGTITITNADGETAEVSLSATTYSPVEPDVFELATEVTFTDDAFTVTPDFATLHDDYLLPNETKDNVAPDAVYALTLENEKIIDVNIEAAGANYAIYKAENIGNGNGPQADNNYNGVETVLSTTFSFNFDDNSTDDFYTINYDEFEDFNWAITEDGTLISYSFYSWYDENDQYNYIHTADERIVTNEAYTITPKTVLTFDATKQGWGQEAVIVEVTKDGQEFIEIGSVILNDVMTDYFELAARVEIGSVFTNKGIEFGDYNIVLRHNNGGIGYVTVDNLEMTERAGVYEAGDYYLVAAAKEAFTVNVELTDTNDQPVEPTAPANVTAEAISDSEIVLSWDAVDGALAYGIYMYGEWLGGTYDTSITVEGLSPETEYCFTVISVSEIDEEGYIVGYSAESEQACATTKPIGVAEFSTAFNIYPNPANDVLFVENGSNIEQVTIYNVTGVMVYNEQCTSNNVQVNVADLEAGVYIIKVRTENNEVINRFVKK